MRELTGGGGKFSARRWLLIASIDRRMTFDKLKLPALEELDERIIETDWFSR